MPNIPIKDELKRFNIPIKDELKRFKIPATDEHKLFKIPYTKEQILKIFKRYDKDGDGQLSKAELKEAFAELGSIWPGLRAWEGRRHADDNGDGFISIDKELDKLGDHVVEVGYTVN